ncbi:MAG TPA: enoyl-CoA hydratase-related protein [Conexibacter sp.]|jgi:enoyl-CoA hydratase/carnithine racemase
MTEPILIEDIDGVRLLTLNRPQALNAFDAGQYAAMRAALAQARDDDAIACVLVTGAGRAFSAGSDLGGGSKPDGEAADPFPAWMAEVEAFPKPLIAAVNGLAVGIAATMLGHFDLVFAAASARFRLPFASLGLVPEAGSTATLPALIGPQAAAHAFFTGSWVSAQDALANRLVWHVAPDEELLERALGTCREIAAMPVESLVATKQLLLAHRLPPAQAAREREEAEFTRLLTGPAHREALTAFHARRSAAAG